MASNTDSPWRVCDAGSHQPTATRITIEGFMGVEIPAAKLCDGNVYFLIPLAYAQNVINSLTQMMDAENS